MFFSWQFFRLSQKSTPTSWASSQGKKIYVYITNFAQMCCRIFDFIVNPETVLSTERTLFLGVVCLSLWHIVLFSLAVILAHPQYTRFIQTMKVKLFCRNKHLVGQWLGSDWNVLCTRNKAHISAVVCTAVWGRMACECVLASLECWRGVTVLTALRDCQEKRHGYSHFLGAIRYHCKCLSIQNT